MKQIVTILFAFLSILGFGQTTKNSLSTLLWSRVQSCLEHFDEEAGYGYEKIDDSKNGYLRIRGSYPTCGCYCSATVGAYKDQKGEYILLQVDEESCDFVRKISSNKALKNILPKDFGLNNFASEPIVEKATSAAFFIDFEIPRVGTDTKATVRLIPFGISTKPKEWHTFEYQGTIDNSYDLNGIHSLVKNITDEKTLNYILEGKYNQISSSDAKLLQQFLESNNGRNFKTNENLQKWLKKLYASYLIYSQLDTSEVILGWDRQSSKFFIKSKGKELQKLTFKQFLISNEYWTPTC